MARGKRPSLIPTRIIEVQLPRDLIAAVDARLFDPALGKAAYGARPALIHRLLSEWVQATPVSPKVEEALRAKQPTIESLLAMEGPN